MTFCGPLDGGEASVNCGLFVGDRFAEEVWLFTAGRAQNSLIDVGQGDAKRNKTKAGCTIYLPSTPLDAAAVRNMSNFAQLSSALYEPLKTV